MKLKSFKRYLKEDQDKNALNAFVENTFQGNWGKTSTDFGNFIEEYNCKDDLPLYRILFFSNTEMANYTRVSDLKQAILAILTKENEGHPRFYTKDDYHNIKDHLSFLSGIGQKIHGYTEDNAETNYMGIIFERKAGGADNVDFANYDGKIGNKEIADRIEKTKPVLSVNATSFRIVASLEFINRQGWTVNDINKSDLEDNINNAPEPEEEPVDGQEVNPEDNEELTK